MGSLLKQIHIPLNGIPSLYQISCPTQLVNCKLAECAECALTTATYVIIKDTEQNIPLGTPLVSNLRVDIKPLIIAVWMQSFSQLLIHGIIHPSDPCHSNL